MGRAGWQADWIRIAWVAVVLGAAGMGMAATTDGAASDVGMAAATDGAASDVGMAAATDGGTAGTAAAGPDASGPDASGPDASGPDAASPDAAESGAAGSGATAGGTCPDSGIQEVAGKIRYGPMKKCGTGISVNTGPLTIHSRESECPTFAIYEPPHHIPVHKPGFETSPGGQVPILLFTFRCVDRWLLGFIPIPIGSNCTLESSKPSGTVQNYVEFACDRRNDREPGMSGGRGGLPGGK